MSSAPLCFGPFELRPVERQLRRDGQPLALGARAFDLLLALVAERGRLVTKDQLLDRVWPGLVVEEANIQVQVSALRKALGAQAIATVPGIGYRFAMALQDDEAAAAPAASAADEASSAQALLPLPLDDPIGRDADLRALDALMAGSRLVSIVGPGGIGKTTLALAWAQARRDAQAAGVWWIELAALSTPERIAPTLAAALRLGLGEAHDEIDALRSVARALASRDGLLVLDNCEHLVRGVAHLVRAVLATAAGIRVLATSREPLELPGEQVLRLGPLSVPQTGASLHEARGHGALQLLERRARAIDRRFELADDNLGAVVALCRRLDGHPLAIEMAAARLPSIGAAALEAKLGERLIALRGASRDAPPRQQTLRATLDWSHALLAPPQQAVLRRLAVFRGSFDLERALRVVADDALDADAALDALAELVDKSLVRLERLDPPRYRLTDMTRLYAAERLADAGETLAVEHRHGLAMAARADESLAAFWDSADGPWIASIAADADDLQAAADRALAARDVEVAAPVLELLIRLDVQRGLDAMLRPRMRMAQQLLPFAQGAGRARLLQCAAPKSPIVLPQRPRVQAAAEAVDAWRALDDRTRLHETLLTLAYELAVALRGAEADAALSEAIALTDPLWGARRREMVANCAGSLAHWRGDVQACLAQTRLALALAQAAGDELGALKHRLNLANVALLAGDAAESAALGHAVVADLERFEAPALLAMALGNLCAAQLRLGDTEAACASAARSLPLSWLHGQAGFLLDHVTLLAARRGDHEAAARLLGYVDTWYAAEHHEREANEAASVHEAAECARAALGPVSCAREREVGVHMSEDEARALARRVVA